MARVNWYQVDCYALTSARRDLTVETLQRLCERKSPTPVSGKQLAIAIKNQKEAR